jgi:3-phenylpropionate/trans-cinnamate dioxygenase ferredoxin component
MTDWIKVCSIDSLKPGVLMDFDFNDKKILLVKINNKIFASDRICTHAYADLTNGFLNEEEKTITCPLHMSAFNLKDGKPLNQPAEEPLMLYETKIDNNSVFIHI